MSPQPPDPRTPAPPDQLPNGRFAVGNRAGSANRLARRMAAARRAISLTATPRAMRALALKLRERALQGSVSAAKLYLEYALGRHGAATDPHRVDGDEVDEPTAGTKWPGRLPEAVQAPTPAGVPDVARAVPAAGAPAGGGMPDAPDAGRGAGVGDAGAGLEAGRVPAEGHGTARKDRRTARGGTFCHPLGGVGAGDGLRQVAPLGDPFDWKTVSILDGIHPQSGRRAAPPGGGNGRPAV